MLPEQDRERLLHIRDAARQITTYTAGISEEGFTQSDLLQHAVIHCLEWDVIRGMRNRLAHAYFDINLGLVWYSATIDTPRLATVVEQLLSAEGE